MSGILFLGKTEAAAADSADSAAAAAVAAFAPSAYAISGKKSEICLKNSILPAAQLGRFPLVGEASAFLLGCQ